ncbi:hypothetical protein SLEP1_g22750 [Rubroshorea leprosula]|uniref:Aminotransferase-like plant mobile domain-containing protein n=1 Tax=Rubroshorea leprosula TaxID=152421 RepID=A0AAV5JJE5_9ROSI|nr:hypothetical protein SLEP1_g22750 [Rubroshorea leprosula]
MEDWSSWAKEMLVENGFVEILLAIGIFKSVALSQTLRISRNVECLRRLVRRWCMKDPRHIALTLEEHATLVALKKVMKKNANASSHSWRGKYSIDFSTWIRYFQIGKGKDSPYVRVAFLTGWLSTFVFGGFSNHEIMAERIPLAIRSTKGVRLPLAPLMLGTLYHMLDLLYFDEILGANYYIIESHVCLSLLQMFAWERFLPYHSSCVTSGKALKEYLMAKCGYISRIAPLACSWVGKRKIKGNARESNCELCRMRLRSSGNASSSYAIHVVVYYIAGGMQLGVLLPPKKGLQGNLAMIKTFLLLLLLTRQIRDSAIRTHLSNLAKAYLKKIEFGMAGGDMVESLNERIKEQMNHIKEMEKSLAEMKELIIKLEEGLVSTKAYLGSLNQEKEHLNSSSVTELRQACMEAAKAFGDETSPFLP